MEKTISGRYNNVTVTNIRVMKTNSSTIIIIMYLTANQRCKYSGTAFDALAYEKINAMAIVTKYVPVKALFLIMVLQCQSIIAQPNMPAKEEVMRKIDSLVFRGGYGDKDAPGLSIISIFDGQILAAKSYGMADLENRIANTEKTNFRIASVSKQFTAMAVMILKEQGKLSYGNTIGDFFPAFPDYGKSITVRQLLTHTSGLKDYAESIPADQTEQITVNDVLAILEKQASGYFLPGQGYKYSNSGYVMLALIVEKVSGQSFADFMHDHIFQPLGMNATIVKDRQHERITNRAYGYSKRGAHYERTDQSITSGTYGDGGIYSSVDDLFKWDQALYTTKLVSAGTLQEAFTPGTYGNNEHSDYGFGWSIDTVRGYRKISHEGASIGFRSYILRLPYEKFSVIVLMNLDEGDPIKIANGVARIYFPDMVPQQPPVVKVDAGILRSYEAFYEARGGISYFKTNGRGLRWIGITATPIDLLPENDSTFFYEDPDMNPEGNWRVVFTKDGSGRTTGYQFQVSGKTDFPGKWLFDLSAPAKMPADTLLSISSLKNILAALSVAGEALKSIPGVADGLSNDLVNVPQQNLLHIQSILPVFHKNVRAAGIERHGSPIESVRLYRIKYPTDEKYLVIYLSKNGLVADEDVVDEF
ncbi:MAG TPA: serine hydrolase domain-containing protein [Chitinophagaceae bacterium]|nr:serine hydrolase domain-containing protein [Chitinophagaceae bacterium]